MLDQAGIRIAQGNPIACERINGINDNMTKSHFHNYFELYYLENGERYHMLDDQLYCIHSGEFILFAPYVMHYSYGEENVPFKRLLVYFEPSCIADENILNRLLEKSGVFKCDSKTSTNIHNLMERLLNEQDNPGEFCSTFLHTVLTYLALSLIRLENVTVKPESASRISNILTYIHEHYNEEITLELLSNEFYISPYYLCREFKKSTGSTITQYINTTRIMNAQRQIMETNNNFTEISKQTGFSNVTHFNRVFKQATGLTPSAYKKSLKTPGQNQ